MVGCDAESRQAGSRGRPRRPRPPRRAAARRRAPVGVGRRRRRAPGRPAPAAGPPAPAARRPRARSRSSTHRRPTQRAAGWRAPPIDDGDALVVATSGHDGRAQGRGAHPRRGAQPRPGGARAPRRSIRRRDRWLACLPLAHVGGLGVVTRALVTGDGPRRARRPSTPPRRRPAPASTGARSCRSCRPPSTGPTPPATAGSCSAASADPVDGPPTWCAPTASPRPAAASSTTGRAARRRRGAGRRRRDPAAGADAAAGLPRRRPTPRPHDGWLPTGDLGELDAAGGSPCSAARRPDRHRRRERVARARSRRAARHPSRASPRWRSSDGPTRSGGTGRRLRRPANAGDPPTLDDLRDHVRRSRCRRVRRARELGRWSTRSRAPLLGKVRPPGLRW